MPSTPPPTPNADLVRDRLRARARRISIIRRRVVAAALATFAIAFGTIAASGSLGSTAASDSTQTTSASRTPRPPRAPPRATTTPRARRGSTSSVLVTSSRPAARPSNQTLQSLGRHDEPVLGAAAMLATTVNDHLFWITSRAAGTLALLFSSVAVGVGLSMGGKLIQGARARPARHPRGALDGDHRRHRGPRRLAARRQLPASQPRRHHDPFASSYMTVVDHDGDRRRLDDDHPRPLVLRARAHRPAALAQAAPLHRARLDPRPGALARRGHRRRQAVVPRRRRGSSCSRPPRCSSSACRPRRPAPRAVAPEAVAR